jgi:hypothetical protein
MGGTPVILALLMIMQGINLSSDTITILRMFLLKSEVVVLTERQSLKINETSKCHRDSPLDIIEH